MNCYELAGERKPKVYPKEVIDKFIQKNKSTGILKYMDIFRHCKSLYENELCDYECSENVWRKPVQSIF